MADTDALKLRVIGEKASNMCLMAQQVEKSSSSRLMRSLESQLLNRQAAVLVVDSAESLYAKISLTTFPLTSVSRKSLPACRKVSFS